MKIISFILFLGGVIIFTQCKSDNKPTQNNDVITTVNYEKNDAIVIEDDSIDTMAFSVNDSIPDSLAIGNLNDGEAVDSSAQDIQKEVDKEKPSPKPKYVKPKPKPTKFIGSIDSILFDSLVFNFDTITAGDVVKHNFNFINSNVNSVEVSSTFPDCGCTTPSFPFLPLKNKDKGFIGVTYNSVGKSGEQNATVHVKFLNVKDEVLLTMSGFVREKPKAISPDQFKEEPPVKEK